MSIPSNTISNPLLTGATFHAVQGGLHTRSYFTVEGRKGKAQREIYDAFAGRRIKEKYLDVQVESASMLAPALEHWITIFSIIVRVESPLEAM
ncbi:hypothetical protein BYT27DRAFT_7258657 [Phlegmacium glaucopus]|nr:hypothetical protein BYT27DRAFT_7258657 [Phlegmacium glaucopus]